MKIVSKSISKKYILEVLNIKSKSLKNKKKEKKRWEVEPLLQHYDLHEGSRALGSPTPK